MSAKDKATGKDQHITIQSSGGLNDAEIQEMINRAEKFKDEDKKKREFIDLKNEADSVAHNTEKSLNEHKSKLQQNEIDEIQKAINDLKAIATNTNLTVNDLPTIKQQIENCKQSAMKIGQAIYKSQGQQQQGQQQQGQQQGQQQQGSEQQGQ